ncbi:hypothetical protein BDR07DRAFT_1464491 [Suillus spraguei]|nr:hypothetical protein BDR07DRAFT_1464491 [Suillus spraguei]
MIQCAVILFRYSSGGDHPAICKYSLSEKIPKITNLREPIWQALSLALATFHWASQAIPVRDGVERLPTPDDLDVNYWVKQCNVSAFQEAMFDGKYMLYWERPYPSTALNRLLTSMSGCKQTFHGSGISREATNFLILARLDGIDTHANDVPNERIRVSYTNLGTLNILRQQRREIIGTMRRIGANVLPGATKNYRMRFMYLGNAKPELLLPGPSKENQGTSKRVKRNPSQPLQALTIYHKS